MNDPVNVHEEGTSGELLRIDYGVIAFVTGLYSHVVQVN